MRVLFSILLFLIMSPSKAEVGKVINLIGSDAYLLRGETKHPLTLEQSLELNDKIHSMGSIVVLYLSPSSQLSLSKHSEVMISESLIQEGENLTKTESIIDLIKGLIRLQVVKESGVEVTQKIRTKDVSFGVRGTDFEVKLEEDEVLLDVYEGEVEVTSPHVNTFVPYFIKGNEGFRYGRRKQIFEKMRFSPRFREAGFRKKDEIRERWKKRRMRAKGKAQMKKSRGRKRALRRQR